MFIQEIHCRNENDSTPRMYQDQMQERTYKKIELPDPDSDALESWIDQTLEDSFPASDPPSWTLGREPKHE